MLNRRTLIGGLAVLPATAAPACALAPSGSPTLPGPHLSPAATPSPRPAERALHHWREFCAAIEEVAPSVDRWQVFGSHTPGAKTSVRVDGLRKAKEDMGRGLIIDVEHSVYQGVLTGGDFWRVEYEA